MAIHWKYKKGLNSPDTTNEPIYTYIDFPSTGPTSPTIRTGPTGATPLGNIVTTDAPYEFSSLQVFSGGISLTSGIGPTGGQIQWDASSNNGIIIDPVKTIKMIGSGSSISDVDYVSLAGNSRTIESISGGLTFKQDNTTVATFDSTKVTFEKPINAPYFNATSDYRAKEFITPITLKALPIVNHIPIFTFNYKDKPNEKSLGMIAQQVQQFDIEGFSLVDHPEATGQDGDYMTIHESKLIYVLWKAVQELSAQVDELEKELERK